MNKNYVILFLLFSYISYVVNMSHAQYYYLRLRNASLRLIIKKENYFNFKNSLTLLLGSIKNTDINRIKNTIITKYGEINEAYYNLSEDDRAIIEFIFALCY